MRVSCHRTGGDDVYVVRTERDDEQLERRDKDGRKEEVGENGERKARC